MNVLKSSWLLSRNNWGLFAILILLFDALLDTGPENLVVALVAVIYGSFNLYLDVAQDRKALKQAESQRRGSL